MTETQYFMSEPEWLASNDPGRMLFFAAKLVGERKVRLFTGACCRLVWEHMVDPRSRAAVEFVEERVDRPLHRRKGRGKLLQDAVQAYDDLAAYQRAHEHLPGDSERERAICAALAAENCIRGKPTQCGATQVIAYTGGALVSHDENSVEEPVDAQKIMSELLREIVRFPLSPITIDPRWRTSDVVGLARAIYDDRAFERIPILADALMDAGCENEEIIGHCRGEGPHVRGCWVVDLILGKQ